MADMNNAPRGRHFKQPAGQGAPGAQMPQQPPMNGHGGRAQQGGAPYGSPAPSGTPSCRPQPQRHSSGAAAYAQPHQGACGRPAGGSPVPPKKLSKTPFIVAGIIVVLLGVLGGVGAAALFSAKDLKAQASEVLTCVDGLSESVKAQDFGAAAEDAQQIASLSGDMVDKLSSPLWTAVLFVPVVGQDITSARTVVGSLNGVANDVLVPMIDTIAANPMSELISSDKTINVEAVSRLFGALGDAAEPMQECTETIEAVPPFHISTLEEKMGPVREKLVKANGLVQKAAGLAPIAESVLGAKGDRAYLIAAQNSTEMRASGGFPGSIGVLHIRGGKIELDDFSTVYDVMADRTSDSMGVTDQEKALFGEGFMMTARDAGMDPDFTRVAEIWANAYTEKTGVLLDGVISVTPAVVQDLLAISGSITLADGMVLDGSNATKILQSELYWKYLSANPSAEGGNDAADALFAQAADLAFEKFFSGLNSEALVKFMKVMMDGFESRSVMFWLSNPDEQAELAGLNCSGAIVTDPAKPAVGTYFSLWIGSKMGWYIDIDNEIVSSTQNADGSRTYSVKTTFRNTASSDVIATAGNYITGALSGFDIDNLYPEIFVYAPTGGSISNFSATNGAKFVETEHEGLQVFHASRPDLRDGESISCTYDVTVSPEATEELAFMGTPTLTKYRQ